MNIENLIPAHKDDQQVIERLKRLSYEEIESIIPQLLEWLQDINWPIFGPIEKVLTPHASKLTPELIKILHTNDGLWKLWILTSFGRTTSDPVLLQEIRRVAEHPTRDETEEEVDLEAQAILRGDYR